MTDCIFCRIAAGELPARKVYEDGTVLAFLDIAPLSKGHTLVIPREHYDPITDTPVEILEKLITAVRMIARAQYEGLKALAVNITQANGELAGQVVPHIHFHVIPRFERMDHRKRWTPSEYEDTAEMDDYASRIQNAVRVHK